MRPIWTAFLSVALSGCLTPKGESGPLEARPLIADCGLPVGTALPDLTAGPEGPALLFVQEKGDTVNLRWASWDGERWSDTVTIAKGTDFMVNWADRPALAFGDGDDAHAHWLQVDPRGDFAYSIQTTHSEDGGTTWSAPDVPHRDTAVAEHGFGQWMVGQEGTLFAWLDGRCFDGHPEPAKAPMEVRTAAWTPALGWSEEVVIDSSACTCCPMSSTALNGGHMLAYRDRSAEEIRDFSAVSLRIDTLGMPQVTNTPQTLGPDGWYMPGCPVNGAALASAGDRTLAVWFTAAGDSARIRSAWHSEGSWKSSNDLQRYEAVGRAAAAVDGRGHYYAAWLERQENVSVLVGQSWDPQGSPQFDAPLVLTAAEAERAGGFPTMTGLDHGGVLLAWTTTGKEAHVRTAVWPPSPE